MKEWFFLFAENRLSENKNVYICSNSTFDGSRKNTAPAMVFLLSTNK